MASINNLGSSIPDSLIANLTSRDVAIWVTSEASKVIDKNTLADALLLPWQFVVLESNDSALASLLSDKNGPDSPQVRHRGYPTIIDNPADTILPPRNLPIYRLIPTQTLKDQDFDVQLKRLLILDAIKKSGCREIYLLSTSDDPIPEALRFVWQGGLRTNITVISKNHNTPEKLLKWCDSRVSDGNSNLLDMEPELFCSSLIDLYNYHYAKDRVLIRVRNSSGEIEDLNISNADDPQYPLLEKFKIIQANDLRNLSANDLTAKEVHNFFNDPAGSWRPYAAGLPWVRSPGSRAKLIRMLHKLDREGSNANQIALLRSESGAGGTTLAYTLAWSIASVGYPTLVAKRAPFVSSALEITTFLNHVIDIQKAKHVENNELRLYETPWMIIYDRDHWDGKESELEQLRRAIQRSGRAVCILLVSGPLGNIELMTNPHFKEIATLKHEVPTEIATEFGEHINKFLAPHGEVRTKEDWRAFFERSSVYAESGVTAFWVTLSFWLQRQIDMNETLQSWLYRLFTTKVNDSETRQAIISIAALSSERRPLPETILPPTSDWPISHKLEDIRSDVAGLGLVRMKHFESRFWALAHDLLGRYLLNAIYQNPTSRNASGYAEALNSEHFRFLILRQICQSPAMGLPENYTIARDFSVNIFKIDPDHGKANFALYWKEALDALDDMPKNLWRSSRTLRHHSAISRRRIANDEILFNLNDHERAELLSRAVFDIEYAINEIPDNGNEESNLHLYNSLARAYQDLYKSLGRINTPLERLEEVRVLGWDATRAAFALNPESPFVIETYARGLLDEAEMTPERVAVNSLEVLNIVFSELGNDRSTSRTFELNRLAERAVGCLIKNPDIHSAAENTEHSIITQAIMALTGEGAYFVGALEELPTENRMNAAKILSAPSAQGNVQVIRLQYLLRCIDAPKAFSEQLTLLELLYTSKYPLTPQQKLELALLMSQRSRFEDSEEIFRNLRPMWRTGEYFADVPERLKWLWQADGANRLQVTARVESRNGTRGFARVQELRGASVPFRSQEFGQDTIRPGVEIRAYISFGHNGPFLRPLTAGL